MSTYESYLDNPTGEPISHMHCGSPMIDVTCIQDVQYQYMCVSCGRKRAGAYIALDEYGREKRDDI